MTGAIKVFTVQTLFTLKGPSHAPVLLDAFRYIPAPVARRALFIWFYFHLVLPHGPENFPQFLHLSQHSEFGCSSFFFHLYCFISLSFSSLEFI